MPDRTIVYMPLADLKAAKRNPKTHADADLAASYVRFGLVEPQVLDERTGRLVSGHGRLASLRASEAVGGDPPDGVDVRVADGVWLVPVVRGWRSRNDVEAAAALVAVNRLGAKGGWDVAMLVAELDSVAKARAGLVGVGFAPDDLSDMLASLQEVPVPAPVPGSPFGGSGVRAIVLDYPTADFDRIARQLQALRSARGVVSNAEVFAGLVVDAAEAAGIRLGA